MPVACCMQSAHLVVGLSPVLLPPYASQRHCLFQRTLPSRDVSKVDSFGFVISAFSDVLG